MSHDQPGSEMDALGRKTLRIVQWRLLPLITLLFTISQIDRTNIGYAALTMNADLGLTPTVFGWIAGIFFFGYVVLEVPSNLVLNRVGARLWITRIMVTWGLISAATAFAQGPRSLTVLRFLLGAAEAGFLPGMTLYLTWWIPARQRARVQSVFFLASPIAGLIGGPLASLFLQLNGVWGLRGWQWMFLLEGVPAVLLGIVTLRSLIDRPRQAPWLLPEQREWLETTMLHEREAIAARGGHSLRAGVSDWRVIYLGLSYVGLIMGLYGVAIWTPTILKGLGTFSNAQVGLVSAIPFGLAGAASVVWGWISDRGNNRIGHVAAALLLGAFGFAASALAGSTWVGTVLITIAAIGVYSALPIFWTLPTSILTGVAAAGGIALVNAMGNVGGFAGPFLVGWIRDTTGSFVNALLMLAAVMALSALMLLLGGRRLSLGRVPPDVQKPQTGAYRPIV